MPWLEYDQKLGRIKAKLTFLYNIFLGVTPESPLGWDSRTVSGLAYIMAEILEELESLHQEILEEQVPGGPS